MHRPGRRGRSTPAASHSSWRKRASKARLWAVTTCPSSRAAERVGDLREARRSGEVVGRDAVHAAWGRGHARAAPATTTRRRPRRARRSGRRRPRRCGRCAGRAPWSRRRRPRRARVGATGPNRRNRTGRRPAGASCQRGAARRACRRRPGRSRPVRSRPIGPRAVRRLIVWAPHPAHRTHPRRQRCRRDRLPPRGRLPAWHSTTSRPTRVASGPAPAPRRSSGRWRSCGASRTPTTSSASPRSPKRTGLRVSTAHRIVRALCGDGFMDQDRRHRPLPARAHPRAARPAAPPPSSASRRPAPPSSASPRPPASPPPSARARATSSWSCWSSPPRSGCASTTSRAAASASTPRAWARRCSPTRPATSPGRCPPRWTSPRYTDHTVVDRDALVAELAAIRERGYAVNDQGRFDGVVGVAAPLLGPRRPGPGRGRRAGPEQPPHPRRAARRGRRGGAGGRGAGDAAGPRPPLTVSPPGGRRAGR